MRTHSKFHKPYRLIGPLFYTYRARIFFGLFALVTVDIFQLLIPRVIKSAIDGLGSTSINYTQLRNHALIIVLFAIGVALFRFFWRYLVLGFSRLLERDIRNALFSHLMRLDMAFYQKKTTGELMALSSNDLSAVQLACGMGLISLVDALLMSVSVLIFMAYINVQLTLIAVCPLPILAVATRILSGRLHRRFQKVQEHFSKMTEQARSTISSMRLIKIYTRENQQIADFDQMGKKYIDYSIEVAKIQGTLFPLSGLIANSSLILVLVLGGKMAINGIISLGDFVAFISYLFMMTWPMMAIGWVANLFQRGLTSLDRIQTVLEEKPVLLFAENHPTKVAGKIKKVRFQNLHFTYPTQEISVLNGVTFFLNTGITGIVGKTGSGKSTLCHLLARLYPVSADSIFINGIDINQISLHEMRQQTAYVPQEPILFSDTVTFNISFGKPDASLDEIQTAAINSGIHNEILSLPNGYNTKIGEKGVKLSGGQRQRIAIARAIITNSPLIIIDDGLSAVDPGTEQIILSHLDNFSRDKIVVIVSHRLTSLAFAKNIAVMDTGVITDIGSHEQLLQVNPYYQDIFVSQSQLDTK